MAVHWEFIDFIIPIAKIDAVYPGGFKAFKLENLTGFEGRMWHDEYLFRDGAMSPMDIQYLVEKWETRGLKGISEKNGQREWTDFCVVEGLFGGPTLPCDWLVFDSEDRCVYLKGKDKGKIAGRTL